MRPLPDASLEHLRQVVLSLENGAGLPEVPPRYRVIELLGQGGMGAVYRVEDRELGRFVALKVMRDLPASPDAPRRMMQEAKIIAGLEHPGIVPVHDVGRLDDGRIFYVMKLIRGRRIDHYVNDAVTQGERLRIFQRICESVAFAHAQGVIHRDIKPQNIMLGEFGEVLVLDWGVAKLRSWSGECAPFGESTAPAPGGDQERLREGGSDTQTRQTAAGTVLGTPAYMSPEQARGEMDSVDQRSDVYALGALLFFLLTGRPPPAGREVPSARRVNPQVPRALDSICKKALAELRQDRYAQVGDLSGDVTRFLNGQAVGAHRENVLERAGRFFTAYRMPILLVLTYLVVRALLLYGSRI